MVDFSWYFHRIRAMSAGECVARLRTGWWKQRVRRNPPRPASVGDFPRERWPLARPPANDPSVKRLVEDAEAYLRHQWFYFGLNGAAEPEIDWHRDPITGKTAPSDFADDIPYRDPQAVGNLKAIWEKNRHHHLCTLGAAYSLTGAERYAAEAADQVLSWVDQNPFLMGVNWISPLESAIRLLSWAWCERLMRGSSNYDAAFGPDSDVWASVYQHQLFIAKAYARGSSANNHLIGEMAGLFVSALAWPVFPESPSWQALARRILEEEIVRQTFPSGLNREQAFGYHLFVTEFFLLALYEAQRAGTPFSAAYRSMLKRMIENIALLADAGGGLPDYGDEDDGAALRLCPAAERREHWLYDLGRTFLDARVPVRREPSLIARLAGFATLPSSPWTGPEGSLAFEDAGLYLLASSRGTPKEVAALVDAGPQGYLSLAAHGHADALSFTLSAGGHRILVDPGTFTYHSEPAWRPYFRGTRSHNTITVDGRDQSASGGTFLWTDTTETRVLQWQDGPEGPDLTAEHDGYAPVLHRRRVVLRKQVLEITDDVQGGGEHEIEWRLHIHPDCRAELNGAELRIRWARGVVRLALDPRLSASLLAAADTGGWYSPLFGVKVPAQTLVGRWSGRLPLHLNHRLEVVFED